MAAAIIFFFPTPRVEDPARCGRIDDDMNCFTATRAGFLEAVEDGFGGHVGGSLRSPEVFYK